MSREITTTQSITSSKLCRATPQETLSLSKQVASGQVSVIALEREVSLATAVKSITLRSAFKGADGVAYSIVHLLCKRFLEAFTFSTKLQTYQVESFTVDTLEAFEYESLDDVVVFFKMARTGKFGAAKKGIDSNLVFGEWLPQYLEQKAEVREQIKHQERNQHKRYNEQVQDFYTKHKKQQQKQRQHKRVLDYIDEITANMDRQMLEDTIISWQKNPKTVPYVRLLKKKRLTIK